MTNSVSLSSSISSFPVVNSGMVGREVNNEAMNVHNSNDNKTSDQVISFIFEINKKGFREGATTFTSTHIHAWGSQWWLNVHVLFSGETTVTLVYDGKENYSVSCQLLIKARQINARAIGYMCNKKMFSKSYPQHRFVIRELESKGLYDLQEDIITFGARMTTVNNMAALSLKNETDVPISRYENWMTVSVPQYQKYMIEKISILQEVLHQSPINLPLSLCSIITEYDHSIPSSIPNVIYTDLLDMQRVYLALK